MLNPLIKTEPMTFFVTLRVLSLPLSINLLKMFILFVDYGLFLMSPCVLLMKYYFPVE